MVDEDPALSVLVVGEAIGADDDVGEAVAVDVAGRAEAIAKESIGDVRLECLRRARSEPAPRAVEDPDESFIHLRVVVASGADDDVGVAVTIDVTGAGDSPENGLGLVAFEGPRWVRSQARSRSEVEVCGAFVELGVCASRGGDDHVGVAVAVDVARCCCPDAESEVGDVEFLDPRRCALGAARRAAVEVDSTFVALPVVESGCADQDVGVAVAVDVTCSGYRSGEAAIGLGSVRRPGRHRQQGIDGHRIHGATVVNHEPQLMAVDIEPAFKVGADGVVGGEV